MKPVMNVEQLSEVYTHSHIAIKQDVVNDSSINDDQLDKSIEDYQSTDTNTEKEMEMSSSLRISSSIKQERGHLINIEQIVKQYDNDQLIELSGEIDIQPLINHSTDCQGL